MVGLEGLGEKGLKRGVKEGRGEGLSGGRVVVVGRGGI